MRQQLRSAIAALAIAAALAAPAHAQDAGGDPLKAQIDGFLGGLEADTHGVVSWDGSDPYEIRQEGADSIAVITNARISIHGAESAQLALDRVELRRSPDKDDDKLVKFAIVFPQRSRLTAADGTQTTLTLKDANASVLVEAQSGRGHETALSLASARVEHAKSGSWVSFGPLTLSSKLIAEADGGFTGPLDFELKQIEFFFPRGPFGGAVDRIAYIGKAAGPSLADLEQLRDHIDELRQNSATPPEAQRAALLALLPEIPAAFSEMRGELECDGLTVRVATGEPLFALEKASISSALTGLDGDNAAFRMTLRHEGLDLAPSVLPEAKVPHRAVVDLGVENVGTAALRSVLAAAGKLNAAASDDDKHRAMQQMLGAAAMLDPVFRIYDIAVETKDVGIDATGATKGSPLSPKGYTADGDVIVRGFDALPDLAAGAPMIEYLPLLRELGVKEQRTDDTPRDTPRLKFHLASAPQKWITINGNDVSAWLFDAGSAPGQPRLLKPAKPPLRGDDVAAVQRALAAANIAVDQTGVYDPATAVAVARFQRQSGINVSGVVDPETRQKLGIKSENSPPRPPGSRN